MPGIVGNGWAKPLAGSPDEAPGRFFDDCGSCKFSVGLTLAADEDRRRRCEPVDTRVADGEARLRMRRRFGKGSSNARWLLVITAIERVRGESGGIQDQRRNECEELSGM